MYHNRQVNWPLSFHRLRSYGAIGHPNEEVGNSSVARQWDLDLATSGSSNPGATSRMGIRAGEGTRRTWLDIGIHSSR